MCKLPNSIKFNESYKDFDSSAINSYIKSWLNNTDGDFNDVNEMLEDLNIYINKGLPGIEVSPVFYDNEQRWVTSFIKEAYCVDDGLIVVEIEAEQVFECFEIDKNEGYDFTQDIDLVQFCKELGSVVVHEIVHLYQFSQHRDRRMSNKSLDHFEYLMQNDEIDAHAISAVEEARSLGYTDKDILRKLSHNAKDLILELDAITDYVDFYGSDYKEDQRVIKRLLKTMSNHVLNTKSFV